MACTLAPSAYALPLRRFELRSGVLRFEDFAQDDTLLSGDFSLYAPFVKNKRTVLGWKPVSLWAHARSTDRSFCRDGVRRSAATLWSRLWP